MGLSDGDDYGTMILALEERYSLCWRFSSTWPESEFPPAPPPYEQRPTRPLLCVHVIAKLKEKKKKENKNIEVAATRIRWKICLPQ